MSQDVVQGWIAALGALGAAVLGVFKYFGFSVEEGSASSHDGLVGRPDRHSPRCDCHAVGVAAESGSRRFERAMRLTGAKRLDVSTRRGSFYCHAVIAHAGQGVVYLATGDLLARSRPCVLKTFHDPSRETVDRASRSIEAQLRLVDAASSRPGALSRPAAWIPDIIGWDMGGVLGPWVAQDFRGANLRKYLAGRASHPQVSEGEGTERRGWDVRRDSAEDLLAKLAHAVEFVHAHGVVHRDLKPENVLIEAAGPFTKIALCDFDLAKADDQTTLTRTGVGMGTPGYSAPEQILGVAPATAASDVYSVGMLAVFLCTGREPYDAIAGSDLTRFKLYPEVADMLGDKRAWVEGALSFWPEDRPPLKDLLNVVRILPHGLRGRNAPIRRD